MDIESPEMANEPDTAQACAVLHNDLGQVISIIVDEFHGDTSAFFESIRGRRDASEQAPDREKDALEAAAARKLAKIK